MRCKFRGVVCRTALWSLRYGEIQIAGGTDICMPRRVRRQKRDALHEILNCVQAAAAETKISASIRRERSQLLASDFGLRLCRLRATPKNLEAAQNAGGL